MARGSSDSIELTRRGVPTTTKTTINHTSASSSSRPAPLNLAPHKFTTESPRPTPRDIYELFPSSSRHDEELIRAIRPAWKRHLHQLLEQPTSSQSAFVVHVCVTALIVGSALITILETVPAFHSIENHVWFGIETALVALFTVEYVGRCVAWSYSWKSMFGWLFCESFRPA